MGSHSALCLKDRIEEPAPNSGLHVYERNPVPAGIVEPFRTSKKKKFKARQRKQASGI